jgi:hypothetical protein
VFGPFASYSQLGVATLRPGQRFSLYYGDYKNKSNQSVTMFGAEPITGRGIGTVVKVVRTQLGVLHPPSQAMPSALYATDPPVYADRHGCVVADLRPENGVVVKPGDEVHFLFVIETVAPGSWSMRTKIVYTRDGQRVEQHAPYRYNGKVANGGSSVRRDSTLEGTCKAPA